MTPLINRLETSEEGSRELDAEVWNALPNNFTVSAVAGDQGLQLAPVTTSLDAAVALVEARLPGANCRGFDQGPKETIAYVSRNDCPAHEAWIVEGEGKTPALAICAALLRAVEGEG